MKVLIFDPFSGCAGDMILGALVSAGVDFESLKSELSKLPLQHYTFEKEIVEKHNISGVKINVQTGSETDHRHLRQITEIIDNSGLSTHVREHAKSIFGRLAEAEAKVHRIAPEQVHFHEVGAVDAIVDIVGVCIAMQMLGVEKIYTRPIALGAGFVRAAHGTIPLPSPATSELVKGFPVVFRKIDHELTTPTGAAIITTDSEPLNDLEEFRISAVGYGAGSADLPDFPNLLRVYVAESCLAFESDQILQIETNLDNQSPELLSFLFEGLFDLGAKDLFMTAVQMKKNRPGILITVICDLRDKDKLTEFIFANTSTSGMRYSLLGRVKLRRSSEIIQTSYGPVAVKVYYLNDKRRYYPEYEDVKRLALQLKISIIELYHGLQMEIYKIKES